jgi:serine/threonine protein phosphatase PrpC
MTYAPEYDQPKSQPGLIELEHSLPNGNFRRVVMCNNIGPPERSAQDDRVIGKNDSKSHAGVYVVADGCGKPGWAGIRADNRLMTFAHNVLDGYRPGLTAFVAGKATVIDAQIHRLQDQSDSKTSATFTAAILTEGENGHQHVTIVADGKSAIGQPDQLPVFVNYDTQTKKWQVRPTAAYSQFVNQYPYNERQQSQVTTGSPHFDAASPNQPAYDMGPETMFVLASDALIKAASVKAQEIYHGSATYQQVAQVYCDLITAACEKYRGDPKAVAKHLLKLGKTYDNASVIVIGRTETPADRLRQRIIKLIKLAGLLGLTTVGLAAGASGLPALENLLGIQPDKPTPPPTPGSPTLTTTSLPPSPTASPTLPPTRTPRPTVTPVTPIK